MRDENEESSYVRTTSIKKLHFAIRLIRAFSLYTKKIGASKRVKERKTTITWIVNLMQSRKLANCMQIKGFPSLNTYFVVRVR